MCLQTTAGLGSRSRSKWQSQLLIALLDVMIEFSTMSIVTLDNHALMVYLLSSAQAQLRSSVDSRQVFASRTPEARMKRINEWNVEVVSHSFRTPSLSVYRQPCFVCTLLASRI